MARAPDGDDWTSAVEGQTMTRFKSSSNCSRVVMQLRSLEVS